MNLIYKTLLIAVCCVYQFVSANTLFAQIEYSENTHIVYLDKMYKPVKEKKATYYCIGPKVTGEFKYYTMKEHRLVKKERRREGKLLLAILYYQNGNIKSETIYKTSKQKDVSIYYFKNGNKKVSWKHLEKDKLLIVDAWDSLGNQTVSNGTGTYSYLYDNEKVSSKGDYKKGKKTGFWNGYSKEGELTYTEEFKKGKLILGKSFVEGGMPEYKEVETPATPPKGYTHLYKYVGKQMRYPSEAVKYRVQGKVYIQFVIDKQGNMVDMKVVRGIGAGCDEEALRALKAYPEQWKPGIQHGVKVKQRMILPISFSL